MKTTMQFTLGSTICLLLSACGGSEKQKLCKSMFDRSLAMLDKTRNMMPPAAQKSIDEKIKKAKAEGMGKCAAMDLKTLKEQDKKLRDAEQQLEKMMKMKGK